MSHDDTAGWFGKLAVLGDFASRRLAPDWVQACDEWLSSGLQASRRDLGERWPQVYLAAPVWRFAWGPGIVDERWWFGVLMPSCDSAGRYFPLVITQVRKQPPGDRIALDHLELWWSHLARAAVQTLAEGAALEDFEAELAQAPPWPRSGSLADVAQPQGVPGRERYATVAGASFSEVAHGLAAGALLQRLRGMSAWAPLRSPGEPGSLTLQAGLPPAGAFAQLLTGHW